MALPCSTGDKEELQGRNAWSPEGTAGYDSDDDDDGDLKEDEVGETYEDKDPNQVLADKDEDEELEEPDIGGDAEERVVTPSGNTVGTGPSGSPVKNSFLVFHIKQYLSYLPRLYRGRPSSEAPSEFSRIVDCFNIPLPGSLVGRPDPGCGR